MIDKLLFLLLALFWGGSFLAIKNTIETIPSFTSAFYRVFFSSIILCLFYFKDLKTIFKKQNIEEILFSSITGLCAVGIPFALLFWGERYVSPSIAAVINGTVPLWTLLFSVVFFGEGNIFSKNKVFGVFLGICGLILIFYPKLILKNEANELLGLLAIIFMAISYAIGINLNRKIQKKVRLLSNQQNLTIQQFVSAIFLGVVFLFFEGLPELSLLKEPKVYLSVLYLSLFSTALAFVIFYRLINSMGSVKAASVTFFVPPVALILDSLIFGRKLNLNEYIGAITVFTSMYFLQKK